MIYKNNNNSHQYDKNVFFFDVFFGKEPHVNADKRYGSNVSNARKDCSETFIETRAKIGIVKC